MLTSNALLINYNSVEEHISESIGEEGSESQNEEEIQESQVDGSLARV